MSNEDDICWYHGKLTRENAENILLQGEYDAIHLLT